MREIKFRAWDGDIMDCDVGVVNNKAIVVEGEDVWFWSEQPKAIMQFTGLKDKNGKEIYEGDIIATLFAYSEGIREEKHIIVFKEGEFVCSDVEDYKNEKQTLGDSSIRVFNQRYRTIIGNIYENPKLLKV